MEEILQQSGGKHPILYRVDKASFCWCRISQPPSVDLVREWLCESITGYVHHCWGRIVGAVTNKFQQIFALATTWRFSWTSLVATCPQRIFAFDRGMALPHTHTDINIYIYIYTSIILMSFQCFVNRCWRQLLDSPACPGHRDSLQAHQPLHEKETGDRTFHKPQLFSRGSSREWRRVIGME